MDEPSTVEEIRALEEALLMPAVRRSSMVLGSLLADDFVEFGASGRTYDKRQVLACLPQQPEVRLTIDDFRIRVLAPGVVLATYRAIRHCCPPRYSLRCLIWTKRQGRWQMVFHQGTPADSVGEKELYDEGAR